MRIEETKIFEFKFPFYGGELSVPIRALSREEAAETLKSQLNTMMIDLASEFPKAASGDLTPPDAGVSPTKVIDAPPATIPTFALELDIETLIKELMPIKKPKGANGIGKLVKDWTGFEYAPENYPAIIEGLRKMKADAA